MNDATTLTQLLLDSDELLGYLHLEDSPERLPLRVSTPTGVELADERLSAGGHPVVVVPPGDEDALRIGAVDVGEDGATLEFDFAPEGVSGRANFVREDGAWRLATLPLVER